VAFLPQFIDPVAGNPTPQMLMLSGVFMLVTFLVFAVYAVFAGTMRHKVLERPSVMAWMRRSFSAGFGLLAVKLAVTQR
jgi:threonine/homoserine/homoserine lactone efflux protein